MTTNSSTSPRSALPSTKLSPVKSPVSHNMESPIDGGDGFGSHFASSFNSNGGLTPLRKAQSFHATATSYKRSPLGLSNNAGSNFEGSIENLDMLEFDNELESLLSSTGNQMHNQAKFNYNNNNQVIIDNAAYHQGNFGGPSAGVASMRRNVGNIDGKDRVERERSLKATASAAQLLQRNLNSQSLYDVFANAKEDKNWAFDRWSMKDKNSEAGDLRNNSYDSRFSSVFDEASASGNPGRNLTNNSLGKSLLYQKSKSFRNPKEMDRNTEINFDFDFLNVNVQSTSNTNHQPILKSSKANNIVKNDFAIDTNDLSPVKTALKVSPGASVDKTKMKRVVTFGSGLRTTNEPVDTMMNDLLLNSNKHANNNFKPINTAVDRFKNFTSNNDNEGDMDSVGDENEGNEVSMFNDNDILGNGGQQMATNNMNMSHTNVPILNRIGSMRSNTSAASTSTNTSSPYKKHRNPKLNKEYNMPSMQHGMGNNVNYNNFNQPPGQRNFNGNNYGHNMGISGPNLDSGMGYNQNYMNMTSPPPMMGYNPGYMSPPPMALGSMSSPTFGLPGMFSFDSPPTSAREASGSFEYISSRMSPPNMLQTQGDPITPEVMHLKQQVAMLQQQMNTMNLSQSQSPTGVNFYQPSQQIPMAMPGLKRFPSNSNMNNPNNSNVSTLLVRHKTTGYRPTLHELSGHIVEFSRDSHGSRLIQCLMESATDMDREILIREVLPESVSLMQDLFGNYVMQNFLEHCSKEQREFLTAQIKKHINTLSFQPHGCRVVQKAIDIFPPEARNELLMDVTDTQEKIIRCAKDPHATHVLQKSVVLIQKEFTTSNDQRLKETNARLLELIERAVASDVLQLAVHPHACRLVQRTLGDCSYSRSSHVASMMETTRKVFPMLSFDQHGNFILQHILDHGNDSQKDEVHRFICTKFLELSQHKFGSHLVEKALQVAKPAQAKYLAEELLAPALKFRQSNSHIAGRDDPDDLLMSLMKDPYANFVVQRALDATSGAQKDQLVMEIQDRADVLSRFTYGRHILSHVNRIIQGK